MALIAPHEMVEVAQRIFPLPLAGGTVAEHDVVAVIAKVRAAVTELVADVLNVLRQAGQEQPAGAGMEGVGVLLSGAAGVSRSGSMLME